MVGTTRIAISGVDGTGKTTVIRKIRNQFRNDLNQVYAFRSPQFHEDALLPFGSLSESIDLLSVEADRRKDPTLKAVALFFSMTLYGDVEKFVLSTYRPSFLIAERQCILDTLAYAQFYLPLIMKAQETVGEAHQNHSQVIREVLGDEKSQLIQAWLKVVALREPSIPLSLDKISSYLVQVFSGTPQDIVQRLLRVYHAELPDQVILLSTSPQNLACRLAEKKVGTPVSEIHEQSEALTQLSQSFKKVGEFLKSVKPRLLLHELNTEKMTVDQTIRSILEIMGNPESRR